MLLKHTKKAMELEESGKYTFEEIVKQLEEFRDKMETYFVLDNLDFLKKYDFELLNFQKNMVIYIGFGRSAYVKNLW